ncbi:MAG TPA: RnfABCDGE type electron transport complex subunit D [Dehalococcoidia bacterium]|nr:RnfABCDGE type electron transport complex subunit D [Dehalococcoidia bacterium]
MTNELSTAIRREACGSCEPHHSMGARLRRLRRFLRSPKGYLILVLIGLAVLAAPSTVMASAATCLAAAILGAGAVELACVRLEERLWRIPSSALLSGLIVGLVLSAQEPWYVAASAGVFAIASKHLLRRHRSHIFNPAAVGLLAVFFLFSNGQSWWGAFANLPLASVIVVLAGGMLVSNRANKLPASLAFLGTYVSLFTLVAILGHGADVADVFRAPFVNMAVFFGFMMLTDPPTSPLRFPAQVWFGVSVAVVCFGAFVATHGLYYLLAGGLVGNLGYAVSKSIDLMRQRVPGLRFATPAIAGFDNRVLNASFIATGFAILLILGAAAAVLRQGDGESYSAARISAAEGSNSNHGAGEVAPAKRCKGPMWAA